jgi:hypothetical protein
MIRKRLVLVFLTIILLVSLGFFIVEISHVFQPQSSKAKISSSGVIVSNSVTIIVTRAQPYLSLDVSPLAFPETGQNWEISVFSQNSSSNGITYYSPFPNAAILVTFKVGSQTEIYRIPTDQLGHAEFQFSSGISDIVFQAIYGGNKSESIVITQHYVQGDTVDFMVTLSVFMSSITICTEAILIALKNKVRMIFSLFIGFILCLSLIQLTISAYVKFFMETAWGYPERIFGFLSWTDLDYASIVGIILFAILSLLAFVLRYRNPENMNVPIK